MIELVKYILKPQESLENDKSFYITILRFFMLIVISFLLKALSVLIIQSLYNLEVIPEFKRDLGASTNSIRNNIFYAALLFPIIEELSFRLYLKRNVINIFISSFFMTYMIVTNFIFQTSTFSLSENGLIRILISLTVALLILYIHKMKKIKLKFNLLYYLSAVLFGLVHIYNYDYTNYKVLIFAIIICLPQITSGLLYGYTRIKYGIIGSIILHMLINGLPMLLLK